MSVEITVFASLKDFYKPSFKLERELKSIQEIRNELIRLNPAAEGILRSCRFAINEEFVKEEHQLNSYDHIYVIPPSSGG